MALELFRLFCDRDAKLPADAVELDYFRRGERKLYGADGPATLSLGELAAGLLKGKNLGCVCPLPAEGQPDRCHAAVLLELANGESPCDTSKSKSA